MRRTTFFDQPISAVASERVSVAVCSFVSAWRDGAQGTRLPLLKLGEDPE